MSNKESEPAILTSDEALAQDAGVLIADVRKIIDEAHSLAQKSVNVALLQRNWLLGKRILEEEMRGEARAEYGAGVIKKLSKELTSIYGKGFEQRTLYRFVRFYEAYPDFLTTLLSKSPRVLSWSHYLVLLRLENAEARTWYEKEALEQGWSVRTLDRNVSTLYYERLLMSPEQEPVVNEMQEKTEKYELNRLEFVKNPVIAEFLGVPQDKSFVENDLEQAILANLQQFLMELGKGYAFVARQQHIKTDLDDFYIDLVFYNYILKCFVLIDLKTSRITHQDVGQMDMYVRMYDDLKRSEGDNPTLGIVLCSETSETIARYSVLNGNEQLFAAKYKLYLPDENELRAEIENQKTMFKLQQETERAQVGGEE